MRTATTTLVVVLLGGLMPLKSAQGQHRIALNDGTILEAAEFRRSTATTLVYLQYGSEHDLPREQLKWLEKEDAGKWRYNTKDSLVSQDAYDAEQRYIRRTADFKRGYRQGKIEMAHHKGKSLVKQEELMNTLTIPAEYSGNTHYLLGFRKGMLAKRRQIRVGQSLAASGILCGLVIVPVFAIGISNAYSAPTH